MTKIKAIIWDIDDTLYNTSQTREAAMRGAVNKIIENSKIKATEDEVYNKIIEFTKIDPPTRFDQLIKFYNIDNSYIGLMTKYYNNYDLSILNSIELYPNTREILEELHKYFVFIVVSTAEKEQQYKKIDVLNIRDYFDFILIEEKGEKEESFRKALEKLNIEKNIKKEEIISVGDRIDREIKVSNKIGVKTIQIKQGLYKDLTPKDDLEKPDYIINNITELPELIKKINE